MNYSGQNEAWVIIPAGGTGERFCANSGYADKLTAPLGGMPVLARTVRQLLAASKITGAILVAHPARMAEYRTLLEACAFSKPVHFVPGGATRRDSVYQGLLTLPETATIAVIHDAARPLVNPQTVDEAVSQVKDGAIGVAVGVPVYDTVKKTRDAGDPTIVETVDRSALWRAQTPQVFQKEIILKAHRQVPMDAVVTDDAQLLELCGDKSLKVAMLRGDENNLKITTPDDLKLAEALLKLLDF